MGEEAGWYRDPAPAHPNAPTTLRYWDGKGWTTQVKQASKGERQAWQAEIAEQQREWAVLQVQQMQSAGYAGEPAALVETSRDVTPDGERLAGWWPRFGAVLLDGVIINIVVAVAGWRFLQRIFHAAQLWGADYAEAAQAGSTPPTQEALMSAILPSMVTFGLIALVVRLAYGVGFLKAFQATPGKMVLGLEVRRREVPGPMSWGTVLARWGMQNAAMAIALVPLAGLLYWVYPLLDGLWPTWDGKRQALHDKVARTNVVTRRA